MGLSRNPPEPSLSWAETQKQRLERELPGDWRTWYVRHSWGISWHAMPPGANRAAVTSDTPDGLLEMIGSPPSWLPEAIERTRKALTEMPEHWISERAALAVQLESLERQQRETGSQ